MGEFRQKTLYPHKCSTMYISNKRNTICAKYTINGFPSNYVSGVKYLGVPISSKMSWSDHIDDICTKERKSLGFIRRNLPNCLQYVRNQAYSKNRTYVCIHDLELLNIILCLHRFFSISILQNCLRWRFNTQIEHTPSLEEEKK